jgi:hypothetical protein
MTHERVALVVHLANPSHAGDRNGGNYCCGQHLRRNATGRPKRACGGPNRDAQEHPTNQGATLVPDPEDCSESSDDSDRHKNHDNPGAVTSVKPCGRSRQAHKEDAPWDSTACLEHPAGEDGKCRDCRQEIVR